LTSALQHPSDPLSGLRRRLLVLSPRLGEIRIGREFDGLGLDVEVVEDQRISPARADLVWLSGAPSWYPRALRSLVRMPRAVRPTVLVRHTEPLPAPISANLPDQPLHARELAKVLLRDRRATDPRSNLRRLLRLAHHGIPDLLVVTNEAAREKLAEHGIQAHVVPLGVARSDYDDLGLERDIDVLFIGALDVPRRKRVLGRLRREGIGVQAYGSWSEPQLWGAERTKLLNRARVTLNLSRFPGQFSGLRFVLAMANGALVLSEPVYRPAPFVPSEHYLSTTVEDMPTVIGRVLEQQDERVGIAESARRFVLEQLTARRMFERIAAIVEAHGR
jgi:hypothetical protein